MNIGDDSLPRPRNRVSPSAQNPGNPIKPGVLQIPAQSHKQVAGELGVNEITVKAHRGKVMRKMKADSLDDLAKMAAKLDPGLRGRNSDIERLF